MNLEFNVYDTREKYAQLHPDMTNELTRLPVVDIFIKPPEKAFWFKTDFTQEQSRNIDFRAPYLHLHNGMVLPFDEIQYDPHMAPILIQKNWIYYRHKTREIVIKKSIFPWQKPLWTKKIAHFYSSEDPLKKDVKILGAILFNYAQTQIDFILNWYSSKRLDDDQKLHIDAS